MGIGLDVPDNSLIERRDHIKPVLTVRLLPSSSHFSQLSADSQNGLVLIMPSLKGRLSQVVPAPVAVIDHG